MTQQTLSLHNNYIECKGLHKRWVVAQMLFESRYEEVSYNDYIDNKPYRYQWTTALQEMKAQRKLRSHAKQLREQSGNSVIENAIAADLEKEAQRSSRFFNREVIHKMLTEYITSDLHNNGWRYTYHDYYKKVYGTEPFDIMILKIRAYVNDMMATPDDGKFIEKLSTFVKKYVILPHTVEKSKTWYNAFRNNGAYFTMRDLIMFHDCVFPEKPDASPDAALITLDTIPDDKLYETMTNFIRYNKCEYDTLCG